MAAYIKTFRLQLTGSAQPLSSSLLNTQSFAVRNESGNDDIYIGDSTVTSTSGMFIRELESNEKEARSTARGVTMFFDLSRIYVLGTAGQYIRVEYLRDE